MPYDKDGKIILPTDIMREFEPWMLDAMVKVGKMGGTKNEIILSTGLPKRLFNAFMTSQGDKYNRDFEESFQMAVMCSQAYWEMLGREASEGRIPQHKSGTFKFMVQNNFRDDYKEEQTIKHETATIPSISEDLDPIEAGKKYKELLLELEMGDFFDV